ncbi:MAG: DUF2341 domain-containing protein [Fibrobacteria bacterium]
MGTSSLFIRLAVVFLLTASALHARSLALANLALGSTVGATYYWNRNDVLTSSTDFSKAYNWTANANGTGARPATSNDDDFTDDALGSAWTFRDYDNASGGAASLTTNADQLTLTGQGAKVWDVTEFVAVQRSDLTGSFDVSVKVTSVASFNASEGKAGILLADDITALGSGGFATMSVKSSGVASFEYDVGGTVGQMSGFASSGSNSFPIWLRMVKNGTAISAFYRTAVANAWTQVGTAQTPQSTDANSQVSLFMVSGSAGTTGTAVFDDFQAGTNMLATDNILSFAGTGGGSFGPDANATLSASQEAASINFTGYTGTFDFGSYTLTLNTGNATFVSGMTGVTAGTGTLAFTAASGTQVLTPKSSATLPNINHSGAGTLQLSTTALTCLSFTQSAGTLDFNSVNVTTASAGDFTLSNGNSSSLANLNGRTLTVAGNAAFTGQGGSLLNLNPASWTLNVTGTLSAQNASLAGSNASGGTAGRAFNSRDGGGNTNWTFAAQTSTYSKSTRFNFNTTSSGANVSGNVSNVPILLRLTSANVDFSVTTAAGSDIQVVDKDGSALYFEVVEWDKANQTGKVWVKVPQVDGNSTTDYITFYYGCSYCTANPYARSDSVFTNFKSVFHLNTPESKAYDAALVANHGAYNKTVANAAGIVTRTAAVFDGVTDYVDLPTESNYDILTNLSVWAWIKVDALDKATQAIVTKGNTSWRLNRSASSNFVEFSGTKGSTAYTSVGDDNITSTGANSGWQHVVGIYDGSSIKLYVNGVQDGTSTTVTGGGSLDNTAHAARIGEDVQTTGRQWRGRISEVRIGNTAGALSADFIKLSYENQKESSTLFSTTTLTTASFSKSKRFTFNTTSSGANVAGNVTDFPLLLRFTDATLIDATVSAGEDIRFLDGDGVTWLDYQIERWDQTNDVGEIWVKIPQVDGNSSADFITMYYQQTGVTVPDGQCASCVFSSGNGFSGVWHLGETSGTTIADATGYGRNGTKLTATEPASANGMVGKGQTFDGTNDAINLGTQVGWINSAAKVTLEGWVNPASTAISKDIFSFSIAGASPTAASRINLCTTTGPKFQTQARSNDVEALKTTSGASNFVVGTWYHVMAVADLTQKMLYLCINGQCDSSAAAFTNATQPSSNTASAAIGAGDDAVSTWVNATLDEMRISGVRRSFDWAKLSFESQRAAPTLWNPSPGDFKSTRKLVFNTTKTGANVMGDVDNFPLLVRLTDANGGLIDAVQNNWNDIRFLDGDGVTWLDYQVERWSKSKDSAEIWVKVPKINGNSATDFITLYYDDSTNGAVANGECASCVFEASNGFKGVWHLQQALTSMTDATASANNGTTQATPTRAGTVIDTGLTFNGSTQYVSTATSYINPSTFTISAWFKTSTTTGGLIMGFGSSATGASGSYDRSIYMTNAGKLYFGVNPGAQAICSTSTTYKDDLWHHAVARLSSNGMRLYVDGAAAMSKAGTTSAQSYTGYWRLGYDNLAFWTSVPTSYFLSGSIDEAVHSNVERSDDWVKLAYGTQRATGNTFWNNRLGPNNKATLTAVAGSGSISLSWTTPVSDSANADSVGLWLKYSGPPDSVGATGQSKVVLLPKTDSTYSYPATYTGTYYFALAVRNTSGLWSPFSAASTDTVVQSGSTTMTDTVYVDSALGNNGNSCTAARSPFTPKLTITGATGATICETNSVNDSLIIRVMAGTYADSIFDSNSKPIVVSSFDPNSRALLAASGTITDGISQSATAILYNDMTLKNLDLRCRLNGNNGVYMSSGDANIRVEGCRIYNNGSLKHLYGIQFTGSSNNRHIANNLIHEPTSHGILASSDNSFNIVNNVVIGIGASTAKGIYMNVTASATDGTIANNILYNWDYGVYTNSADMGVCSNNLFHLVTSGREVTGETDANKIVKDPLFYNMTLGDRQAFKLLPGSPAIDAGTTSYGSGAAACALRSPTDPYGTSRPQGTAPDIGLYEGSGFTPNPTGDFDTLTNVTSGNTVIVKNTKWKLVWDMARGGGITGFYNMSGDSTANLVGTGSLLFDVRIDASIASGATSNTLVPVFLERTRARSIIKQRLAISASLDLIVRYTVHASGHVYVQSEIANLGSTTLDVDVVQYTLKLGTASAVTQSGVSTVNSSYKNGFGFLNTDTRDAHLSVTQDLDGGGYFSETWSQAGSIAGSLDSLGFKTADMADIDKNMKRQHHFLLYVGDGSLDFSKSATLNADAYNPSPVSMSAGSLLHERSWQDLLAGHWTLDDGGGTVAKDKSINYTNDATTLTSTSWVSGKVGGALRFTTSSVASVPDNDALEAGAGRTYMLWVKPDFTMGADGYVMSKGLTTSDGWYFRRETGVSKIKFVMGAASVTSPTLTTDTWNHLAAVVEGSGTVSLYVNGVLAGASTSAVTVAANSSALLFGKSGADANSFKGDIDDVRIYHFPLASHLVQAIYHRGFSETRGAYHLRADNNNRAVALLNESAAQTRVQPAFQIDNWYGPRNPKYVYLNGARLTPNVDFVADTVGFWTIPSSGTSLLLQMNRMLTGSSQTLFVDDDDSSGYMGEASKMKSLAMTTTSGDKIAIKNFSDTVFGSATSGQWYLELDLDGWASPTAVRVTDTGFGEFNSWKAAAINPNVAISSATQLSGVEDEAGRNISHMKFDNTGANEVYSSGTGYSSPADITYTLVDSSSTRLSLILATMTLTGQGTITLKKRFTVYPTGRIFSSYEVTTTDFDMDEPRLDFQARYSTGLTDAWSTTRAAATGRWGRMGGNASFHSFGGALMSIKSAGSTLTAPTSAASMISSASTQALTGSGLDLSRTKLALQTGLFEAADDPITINWALDISRDYGDSATADSLLKDVQTPAALTAISGTTGSPYDALDFNSDNFAEGDGAYIYTAASSGLAQFKFVNTVTHFNPAFRIKSWTFATLPEFVLLDNQILTKDYQYNAYINTATNELILQLNKTLAPATHLFYISHKTGLAVTLNSFEAKGGEGADSLFWTTESEFENLGFNLYRRVAPVQDGPDSLSAQVMTLRAGTDRSSAIWDDPSHGVQALAKPASSAPLLDPLGLDTLPEWNHSPADLKALGYARVNALLIPGADGGSSASTRVYAFIDRTAGFGITYEYLLEAVDFQGGKAQYGPRKARPQNPLETILYSNYPNPFNPVTTLRFSLKDKAKVSLVIYDVKGKVVRTLIRPDRALSPGKYRLLWDARDDRGFEAPSGQYFYRFTAGKYRKTRKMILVK